MSASPSHRLCSYPNLPHQCLLPSAPDRNLRRAPHACAPSRRAPGSSRGRGGAPGGKKQLCVVVGRHWTMRRPRRSACSATPHVFGWLPHSVRWMCPPGEAGDDGRGARLDLTRPLSEQRTRPPPAGPGLASPRASPAGPSRRGSAFRWPDYRREATFLSQWRSIVQSSDVLLCIAYRPLATVRAQPPPRIGSAR